MTEAEISMWKLNIENNATTVCDLYGQAVVSSIFRRYDAHNIDDLSPAYYSEVFGYSEQIANDD